MMRLQDEVRVRALDIEIVKVDVCYEGDAR